MRWFIKTVNVIIDIFGKNSNISITELDVTAIVQVGLAMIMPSLMDLTFGMKFILFHSLRFLVLLHVKLPQSDLE